MMHKGTTHALDEEDLWDLPEEDTASGLSSRLKTYWDVQLEKKRFVRVEDRSLIAAKLIMQFL